MENLTKEYFDKIMHPFIQQFRNHEKSEEEIFYELRLSIDKINYKLMTLEKSDITLRSNIIIALFISIISLIISLWKIFSL